MKTSTEKSKATVSRKRGKPKSKTKLAMENLFQMNEDDLSLLYNDNIFVVEDTNQTSIETVGTQCTASNTQAIPTNRYSSKMSCSKISSEKNSSQENGSNIKHGVAPIAISTMGNMGSLFANEEEDHPLAKPAYFSNVSEFISDGPESNMRAEFSTKTISISNGEKSAEKSNSIKGQQIGTQEGANSNHIEKSLEYSQELTNEEFDGVTTQFNSAMSKDWSFELSDEFLVELSDLEFGECTSEEEASENNDNLDQAEKDLEERNAEKENDLLKDKEIETEKDELPEDESFELPDNSSAIDDEELKYEEDNEYKVEDEEFNPKFQVENSGQIILDSNPNTNLNDNDYQFQKTEDEKFDLDELINAGTNSYSYSQSEVYPGHESSDQRGTLSIKEGNVLTEIRSNPSTSSFLPFSSQDMLQQILQAWAFGDTNALIKLGQETSTEDEPFYSGDDENFGLRKHIDSCQQPTSKVEVIEHPLARYGLKVRTVNAIDFVGEKNYYSLTEESRRELELLIQDLSKTEEGTVRNTQIRQTIFRMFE